VSLARLNEHRRVWQRKPVLRKVYQVWFDALLALAPTSGRLLEVGSGPGLLSTYARSRLPRVTWTASDLIATPWNDLAADALRLPLRAASVDAVLGLDVLHHVARPLAFLAEAARVLRPGSRIGLVEPWVTPFSYPIYRWLHHEGCQLDLDPRQPFVTTTGEAKDAFEGDAAVPWRLVRLIPREEWETMGLTAPRVEIWNGFAYLPSLGFREASLLPSSLLRPLLWLDERLRWAAPCVGLRAVIVWERTPAGAGSG